MEQRSYCQVDQVSETEKDRIRGHSNPQILEGSTSELAKAVAERALASDVLIYVALKNLQPDGSVTNGTDLFVNPKRSHPEYDFSSPDDRRCCIETEFSRQAGGNLVGIFISNPRFVRQTDVAQSDVRQIHDEGRLPFWQQTTAESQFVSASSV